MLVGRWHIEKDGAAFRKVMGPLLRFAIMRDRCTAL